jgi:hypothetical protein
MVLALGTAARAQDTPGGADGPRFLSDAARVSLITILPGQRVYSLFGHNAVRVVDPERGIDNTYNFGTFEFGNPLAFSAKFLYGALDYRLAKGDYDRMVAYYPSRENRPLIEQWLDLDARQREAIFRFLEWNALPENATYRYDFYYDNCATRIRDLFERILGVEPGTEPLSPGRTMRQLLDPYLVERPLLHLGMDFGQGVPADRSATARDAMFLPDHLASWMADTRLRGPDGDRLLVASTDSIGWTPERSGLDPAPDWPELLFGAVLALVVSITFVDVRSERGARPWLDIPLYGLLGIAGLFLVFMWFVSLHPVTKRNTHILWALPTHLVVAWAVARSIRLGPRLRLYLWACAASAAVFLAGVPFWAQEVPLALVPLAAAVGVRSVGLALTRQDQH